MVVSLGRLMRFIPAVGTQELMRFHAALCEKLWGPEKEIHHWKQIDSCQVRPDQICLVNGGRMSRGRGFRWPLFVLDIGWQERGLLAVRMSKDLASKYNGKEGGDMTAYDCGDLGWCTGAPLKRAMQSGQG